jgi:16S rRNA (guanine527-N7)-methyltransferase
MEELVARFGLPAAAAGQLRALLELLARDPQAPTTVTDRDAALEAHVADSLVALELPVVREASMLADLGAGAGFPGLALAAALPEAQVFLVESVGRKCAFLERALDVAGLANARVVCERAETWEAGLEACDLVTARALAALPVLAEYAAPLLRVGGTLVAWKGRSAPGELADGAAAAAALGLEVGPVLQVTPYPAARDRHLHLLRKIAPTPGRFPRRPGMATKRPLRAA